MKLFMYFCSLILVGLTLAQPETQLETQKETLINDQSETQLEPQTNAQPKKQQPEAQTNTQEETQIETQNETQTGPVRASRGCYGVNCSRTCEAGTHMYASGCDYITPEPTCDEPNPKSDKEGGKICDYAACYCDAPTVRDPNTNQCVSLDQCPRNPWTIKCEPGTHVYSTGCDYLTPEATCDEPNPQTDMSVQICDYMACYCDAPTVRDSNTNQCISLDQCSRNPWTIKCEPGTHVYSTGCSYRTPEATCDEPNPQTDMGGQICDYMACYCDKPTVRDTSTKRCVQLDECPKKPCKPKKKHPRRLIAKSNDIH